ncbi:FixH family protein [Bacillus marinisedimentorum]|uniref:FixH family protein n=1 Tax=Bacillus marinisedimentorum TaxID=1821260 RepID=UPI0008734125|nr:FixH family protein [Bacillus marinisedimentorum]
MFKKGFFAIIISIFFLVALTACGQEEKNEAAGEDDLAFPEASFSIAPQEAKTGEEITFEVKVTEAGEPIEDADVRFEIWPDEKEDEEHEMIPIEHSEDGIYTLSKSFGTQGAYSMYYHIDARGMHLMEKHSFTVTE